MLWKVFMNFAIRPYVDTDRPSVVGAMIALQEHERAIHDTRLPGAICSEAYLDKLLKELPAQSGAMFVAEVAGKFAGLVAGLIVDEPWPVETRDSTRYGYVSDIFITPDARGTGLAKVLLDAIAAHLHQADPTLTRLRVNALAVNMVARRAYEKAGFTPYEVMYERRLGPASS
jgi:GNAT superfamily N-acetyltransferase